MSVNGTLVEDIMRRIKGEYAHFSFSKCHIYTDDGASANFSTNSHETDYSVCHYEDLKYSLRLHQARGISPSWLSGPWPSGWVGGKTFQWAQSQGTICIVVE